ncbi:MAG: xanthine dehydrogenase, small subunit, partial [Rhizorhabdus sp.]|nr:xanthine dehydrogenase, small subunit [Rhizorhabdus sp.]
QCGFCTPGFVMSLYGRSIGAVGTAGTPVADVIAGNLCRCSTRRSAIRPIGAAEMGVRFLLDGMIYDVGDVDPTLTLLEFLRYRVGLTGTKEGCAEGDCGACTVLVGELVEDVITWRAVNACILFVPMLDGRALKTVESLGGAHPVQREMVARHGSQCGFCTPGFGMSLYGRSIGAAGTKDVPVKDVIAGNLCRCTGYGPILDAGEAVPPATEDDSVTIAALKTLRRETGLAIDYQDPLAGGTRRWFAPRSADELADLLIDFPNARIVAGATDVGLWVTKQQRVLETIIWLGEIGDLATLEEDAAGLMIGAGVRYVDAAAALARLHPDLGELVRRIGAVQVRNAGTIGGNIANGSPIGDMPPALIALGATVTLRRGRDRRTFALEDYFIRYGVQDRQPGEFVEAIWVPRPDPADLIRIFKLSKRFDSDISAACGAFAFRIEGDVVTQARIAFGGMAGTPQRAAATEAALTGQSWSEASIETAAAALAQDYAPLTDVRGSSAYRLASAANLLRKIWIETQTSEPSHVLDLIDV